MMHAAKVHVPWSKESYVFDIVGSSKDQFHRIPDRSYYGTLYIQERDLEYVQKYFDRRDIIARIKATKLLGASRPNSSGLSIGTAETDFITKRVTLCVSSWVLQEASWGTVLGDVKRIVDYWLTKGRFTFDTDVTTRFALRRLVMWRVLCLIHAMVPGYRSFIHVSETPFSEVLPTIRFQAKTSFGAFYNLMRKVAEGGEAKGLSKQEYSSLVSELFGARLACVDDGFVTVSAIPIDGEPKSSTAYKMWRYGFVTTIDPIIKTFMKKSGVLASNYPRVFAASLIGLLSAVRNYSKDKGVKSKDYNRDPALALLHYVMKSAIEHADVETIRVRGEMYGDAELERLTIKRRYGGAFKQWRILMRCYKQAKEANAVQGIYGTPLPEDIVKAGSTMQASIMRTIDVAKWKERSDGWEKWLYDRVRNGIRVIPVGAGFSEDFETISESNVIKDIDSWMRTNAVPRAIGCVQNCLAPKQIDSLDAFARVRYELMEVLQNEFVDFSSTTARLVDYLYFYSLPLDQFCGYRDIVDDTSGDLARFDSVVERTRNRLLSEGADAERIARFEYDMQEMRLSLLKNPVRRVRKVVIPKVGRLSEASQGCLSLMGFADVGKLHIGRHYAKRLGKCSVVTAAFREAVRWVLCERQKRLVGIIDRDSTVENPHLQEVLDRYFRIGLLPKVARVDHLLGSDSIETASLGLSVIGCGYLQYEEYVPDLNWTPDLKPLLKIDERYMPLYDLVSADLFMNAYVEVKKVYDFVNSMGYFSVDSRSCLPAVVELNCLG